MPVSSVKKSVIPGFSTMTSCPRGGGHLGVRDEIVRADSSTVDHGRCQAGEGPEVVNASNFDIAACLRESVTKVVKVGRHVDHWCGESPSGGEAVG